MGLFDALARGLERSREAINELFYFGGEVTEDFWEELEDTLVMGDMGAEIAMDVSDDLRDLAARKNLKTADQLREALAIFPTVVVLPAPFDPTSATFSPERMVRFSPSKTVCGSPFTLRSVSYTHLRAHET